MHLKFKNCSSPPVFHSYISDPSLVHVFIIIIFLRRRGLIYHCDASRRRPSAENAIKRRPQRASVYDDAVINCYYHCCDYDNCSSCY